MAKYLRITRTARLISVDSKEYNFAIIGEVLKIVATFYSDSLQKNLPVVEVVSDKNKNKERYIFLHHNIPALTIEEHEAAYFTLMDKAVQDQSSMMRIKLLSYIKGSGL